MVDTHAHLYYDNFSNDLDNVLENAKRVGVDYIIIPATDIKSAEKVVELTQKYDIIYGAVGVHPHDCGKFDEETIKKIEELAKNKKIVSIGEIGLDYYYDFTPKEKQIEAFHAQIQLALKLNLPVIVHNRDADNDIHEILSIYCKQGLRGQLHCFSGNSELAEEFVKMGFFISFTGNVTFKKMESIRETAKNVNLKNLLLETDSPFMTPIPRRGKRNEPANLELIVPTLAAIHNVKVEEIIKITDENVFKLFNIGKDPALIFTYPIENNLYINVTNRCNADCIFCGRKSNPVVSGYNLKMDIAEEPEAESYIREIGDPVKYSEIVFCGYGEPTIRWGVIKTIAEYVKEKGGKTRLNSNGHGNVINKRDITPEMAGIIDTVSISLNAADPQKYAQLMRVDEKMFYEMINFTKKCKDYVPKVILSAVALDNEEIIKARKFAIEEVGVLFREREYF